MDSGNLILIFIVASIILPVCLWFATFLVRKNRALLSRVMLYHACIQFLISFPVSVYFLIDSYTAITVPCFNSSPDLYSIAIGFTVLVIYHLTLISEVVMGYRLHSSDNLAIGNKWLVFDGLLLVQLLIVSFFFFRNYFGISIGGM